MNLFNNKRKEIRKTINEKDFHCEIVFEQKNNHIFFNNEKIPFLIKEGNIFYSHSDEALKRFLSFKIDSLIQYYLYNS